MSWHVFLIFTIHYYQGLFCVVSVIKWLSLVINSVVWARSHSQVGCGGRHPGSPLLQNHQLASTGEERSGAPFQAQSGMSLWFSFWTNYVAPEIHLCKYICMHLGHWLPQCALLHLSNWNPWPANHRNPPVTAATLTGSSWVRSLASPTQTRTSSTPWTRQRLLVFPLSTPD